MATIKLFESWLKDQLKPIMEAAFNPNADDGNFRLAGDTLAAQSEFPGYSAWLTSDAGEEFRAFATQYTGGGDTMTSVYDILAALMKNGTKESKLFGITLKGDDKILTKAWEQMVKNGTPSVRAIDAVPVTVNLKPGDPGRVLTRGTVVNPGRLNISVDPKNENSSSALSVMLRFVNQYNVAAFAAGQPQYKLSDSERMVTDDQMGNAAGTGFLDLIAAPDYAGNTVEGGGIYLYTSKIGGLQSASAEKSEEQIEVGGQQAATSQYETDFATGKADVTAPKVAAAVKAAAHEIAQLFPAGKGPDTFKLVSGASADWNGAKLPTSTGTGSTFTGSTPNEKANQKLAYDRGFNFMTAVNAELVKKGHPGFPKFEVSWVIGNDGGPVKNGKYVDLMLATQEVKPTVVTVTKYNPAVSGKQVTAAATGTIFEHNVFLSNAF